MQIAEKIESAGAICSRLRSLGEDYLFAADLERATAHFQRCLEECDLVLAHSQLYDVLYYRAFALLALACIVKDRPGLSNLSGPAYERAMAVSASAGVLRQQIHEVERLQKILARLRERPAGSDLAPPGQVEAILKLLRNF